MRLIGCTVEGSAEMADADLLPGRGIGFRTCRLVSCLVLGLNSDIVLTMASPMKALLEPCPSTR